MNQRKPPNIHDTHGQYNKMPKHTPAELCRMKAEKDSKEQEAMISRRRHEELARQQLLRAQVCAFSPLMGSNCVLTDAPRSKRQVRQMALRSNHSNQFNSRNRSHLNSSSSSSSNNLSRQVMAAPDQLPSHPNPHHKSVLSLRSLKLTSLSNSECLPRCPRQERA